jgi:hypothetical protein
MSEEKLDKIINRLSGDFMSSRKIERIGYVIAGLEALKNTYEQGSKTLDEYQEKEIVRKTIVRKLIEDGKDTEETQYITKYAGTLF